MKLHTEDEIRTAGADAVADWSLDGPTVDRLAAILGPARDVAYGPLTEDAGADAKEQAA